MDLRIQDPSVAPPLQQRRFQVFIFTERGKSTTRDYTETLVIVYEPSFLKTSRKSRFYLNWTGNEKQSLVTHIVIPRRYNKYVLIRAKVYKRQPGTSNGRFLQTEGDNSFQSDVRS